MNDNCYHITTHRDLDGLISLLIFKWAKPEAHISHRAVTNINVEPQIREYLENTINPHNLYVVDIALRESFTEFDLPFVKFIDHHKRSEEFKGLFKQAKVIVRPEYGSNCRMLYKFFSDKGILFTDNQKKLILLGDDFDSGKNSIPISYDLNILFWAEYRSDINKFLSDYAAGFKPFTLPQIQTIKAVKQDALNTANELPVFEGSIQNPTKSDGPTIPIISSMGETTNLLSLDILMKKYDRNIIFFINTKNQKVSMKQRYSENVIDLSILAKKYCEGNGSTFSAGGKITDLFMEVAKNFKPV